MNVLVITNIIDGSVNCSVANLFTVVKELKQSCDVLLITDPSYQHPDPVENLAHSQLKKYDLVKKIYQIKIATLSPLSENLAPVIAKLAPNYSHVIIAADSLGKDLLPRVCGVLDTAQLSEIVKIIAPDTFERFIYAGNVVARYKLNSPIKFLTVRTSAFARYTSATINNANIAVEDLSVSAVDDLPVTVISVEAKPIKIDLTTAKIVVSGGISLGSRENFDNLIGSLANKLGGAVGATRDAVEAGFSANDTQVGQTGKTVAPDLYLAIGLSGAVQHIAGMKDAKMVIAINSDESAPIFEYAHYGLVGDLFEIVPKLIGMLS